MSYLFYSDTEKKIQDLHSELLGLSYIQQIKPLIEEIPVHRGLSVVFLSGEKSFKPKILQQQNKIDQIFDKLARQKHTLDWQYKIANKIQSLKTQWHVIKTDLFSHTAEQTLLVQSQLVEDFNGLIEQISDESGLFLVNNFDSHLLMELLVKYLPLLSNSMGEVRARISSVAINNLINNNTREKIISKLAQVQMAEMNIKSHLEDLFEINPKVSKTLLKQDVTLTKEVGNFYDMVYSKMLQEEKNSASPELVFNQSAVMISAIFATFDKIIPELQQLIEVQIKDKIRSQRITFLLIIITLVLIFIISYRFYKTLNLFKTTLDTTKDAVFMFTADNNNFFYVNQACIDLFAYTHSELMNMSSIDITPKLDYKTFKEIITPLLTYQQTSITFETEYQKKNAHLIPVEVSLQYIEPRGEIARFICIVRDISEQKLMRERVQLQTDNLLESQARLAFAVEGAGDGVWDWDRTTNVVQLSQLYLAMLGYNKRGLDQPYDTWITNIHPDDTERVQQNLNDYLSGRIDKYFIEFRLRCKDGQYKWILCRGTAVEYDKNGEITRMIGIHTDISKQKQIEQNLIDARQEAEYANQTKSQFISNMSHELRTPMNAIIGFSQLLSLGFEQPLTESQQENVDEISKASKHLLNLINEILDLSKIESGQIELSMEKVVVAKVLQDSLQLISPLAQTRGIDISLSKENKSISLEQLEQQYSAVQADYTRLKQVLLNLLSNAVKYNCENGKIIISCFHMENNLLRIKITDRGKGLSAEQQQQLFLPFNRLDNEYSSIEGTGIGLAISKKIIEQMGGNIGVSCEPGQGCSFWIDLSVDDISTTYVDTDVSNRSSVAAGSINNQNTIKQSEKKQSGNTILYIEDNPANLHLVRKILERLPNIHLLTAPEPQLGLQLAIEHQPALILLDINLPGMDGFEVLKKLQQQKITTHTAVVAISANAMSKDIKKAINAGFDAYITKPININELLKTVEKNLTQKIQIMDRIL